MGNAGFAKMVDAEDARILMVGLDCVGKTTMLYRMKQGEVVVTAPTIGFNVESVQFQNMNLTVWDVGSQNDKIRPLWNHYFRQTQGIIFAVDSTDRARIQVARDELMQMLQEKHLQNTPVLVLANKQDLPSAMSVDEVADKLGLSSLQRGGWTVKPTCAVDGIGLSDGLDWLAGELAAPKTSPRPWPFRRTRSSL